MSRVYDHIVCLFSFMCVIATAHGQSPRITSLSLINNTVRLAWDKPTNAFAVIQTPDLKNWSNAASYCAFSTGVVANAVEFPVGGEGMVFYRLLVGLDFATNQWTLTYTAGANGSIAGDSPQTVAYGSNGTAVTAVADPGYHFVDWSDSSTNNPRTDTGVTGDITVTANFAVDPQFETGQEASILLAGIDFDRTGGGLLFNHPKAIATDGTNLAFCDGNNNRVLLWRTLPETSNVPPDLVLGQPDMDSNDAGDGTDEMNWPAGISLHDGKLIVADTYNNRILVWNTIPTTNGAPADLVLEGTQPGDSFPLEPRKDRFVWPWSVWTDGEKLVVTSTAASAEGGIYFGGWVLIWNEFPTSSAEPADLLLTANGDAGTPRGITSDGQSLIIGDHNANNTSSSMGAWVWKNFPTEDEASPDYFLTDPDSPTIWLQGDFGSDGTLYIMGSTLHVWSELPESNAVAPDLSINKNAFGLRGGDCSGVAIAGERVYMTDYNGNRLFGFLSPITSGEQVPDVILGAPDFETDTLLAHYFITNPAIVTDGESLVIGSGYDRTLSIWRQIPTTSGTPPTVRIDEIDSASDIALHDGVLVVAGKRATLKIWNALPFGGEEPDWEFDGSIGSVEFDSVTGIALDDSYFYLSDGTGQIHVWSELPLSGEEPLFTLQAEGAQHDLQSDGQHLVASSGGITLIYEIATLAADAEAEQVVKTGSISASRGEAQIAGSRLYLVDFGYNRVHIWSNWRDAVAGQEPDAYLGAQGAGDIDPGISQSSLFWPKRLAVHGARLWIGEYKFSGRVVLFEPVGS